MLGWNNDGKETEKQGSAHSHQVRRICYCKSALQSQRWMENREESERKSNTSRLKGWELPVCLIPSFCITKPWKHPRVKTVCWLHPPTELHFCVQHVCSQVWRNIKRSLTSAEKLICTYETERGERKHFTHVHVERCAINQSWYSLWKVKL